MGILRSEEMALYWLNMPRESAYDIISALGRMETLQFIDADEKDTPLFSRHFHHNVKRCDETLIKLEEIEQEIVKFDLEIHKTPSLNGYLNRMEGILKNYQRTQSKYFEELETFAEKKLQFMHQLLNNFDDAVQNRNNFLERRAVLTKASKIYNQQQAQLGETSMLSCMAGTISIQDRERFSRTIFRVTKGNALTIIEEISNDGKKSQQLLNAKDRQPIKKCVFIIFFQGAVSGFLVSKLGRVCESYGANVVDIPKQMQQQQQQLAETEKRIIETNDLVKLNENELDKFFREFTVVEGDVNAPEQTGPCSRIEAMRLYTLREKLIYEQMNLLNPKNSIYQGLVWIQKRKSMEIISALNALNKANPNMATGQLHQVENYNIPVPTYTRTNTFTAPFQEIVNTYGTPRYREINPGLFTCITFPFLFGVMYGDIGHGSVMLLFSIYLFTLNPNRAKPGALDTVYPFRFMLFLLAFMAVFCGFMYNDFFGMSLNFFGSCWSLRTLEKAEDCNYPVGLDPVWGIATNKLQAQNSLKMKLSVILGIAQMTMGVFLKAINSIYFRNALDFFFEFIPQLVFLTCTFGYMCFLIVWKWLLNWDGKTGIAPSILTGMLDFFLKVGGTDPNSAELYENQAQIQYYMLIAAVIAVPLMLLPKPLILLAIHGGKKKESTTQQNLQQQQQLQEHSKNGFVQQIDEEEQVDQEQQIRCPYMVEEKEFDFSEEIVHQIIETIEFVLGCISHTASYLRLWALSLAHSKLSEVFFEKILKAGLVAGNPIFIFIGFAIFAIVTLGVLMLMDALECFLHTLRLHWVEFQSKFYKADGFKFAPFSFVKTLDAE